MKKIYLEKKSTSVRSFYDSAKSLIWKLRPFEIEKQIVEYGFKPMPYKRVHAFDDLLKLGKSYYLPVKTTGKYIHVTELGEGPAVILSHGWAANKSQLTSFIPKLIDAGFSVVLYDQPAHGQSTSVSTNLFDFIRSLEALIRYKKDVHAIIAHSMATSAALYNLHLFNHINKAVLISAHYDFEEELEGWFNRRGMPENMKQDVIKYLEERFQLVLQNINPKNVAPLFNQNSASTNILLIHDEGDRAASIKGSEKLEKAILNSKLIKTHKLGHAKILHDELVINKTVEFLKL